MEKNRYLFRSWVPRWMGTAVFVLLFVPILFASGIYTSNSTDMAGGLGILPEHIQFSNIASAVGIAVFTPFMATYLRIRRPKLVYMAGFLAMALLSYVCAVTDRVWLLLLCCYVMGIVRILLLFNNLFCLFQYLTRQDPTAGMDGPDSPLEVTDRLDRMKTKVRLPFYLFMLVVSLWCSSLTARLAYEYKWQYVYHFMVGLMLAGILVVAVTMKYRRKPAAWPAPKHFGDMVCASLMLLSFCFMCIYGKTLDWFASGQMRLALAVFLVSGGLFAWLAAGTRQGYLLLEVFRRRSVRVVALVFVLAMIVNSSSVFVNQFMGVAMDVDNVKRANLGNWDFIGYAVGLGCCVWFVKKDIHWRHVFTFGFLCMLAANVWLYFHFRSEETYANLVPPTILRSLGLFVFYAMGATYGIRRLPVRLVTSWAFVLVATRSVIGPCVGSALYANWIENRQQYYTVRLSSGVDALHPEARSAYDASLHSALSGGKSREQAETLAATSLKARVREQATLSSLKEVCGWTVWFTVGCIVMVQVWPGRKKFFSTIKE